MTPEEERDYQEALRRIKEAEKNKSVELDLGGLDYLTSFPPELARLTSLLSLDLSQCVGVRLFSPLKSLVPTLSNLCLFGCKFDDLPSEVCDSSYSDVLDKVRAHYKDLEAGQRVDAEVKVLFSAAGCAMNFSTKRVFSVRMESN
jgi:hypothetical protein